MKDKRSILITGCSTGIGYSAAHILRERGWQVFPTCRKPEDAERLRSEGFDAFHLDYCQTESIQVAVESVLAITGGRLDALFNNGAYGLPGAIEDLPTDALRRQFETNFFGWHELTRLVIPVMREQGHGRIVQCSSILGLVAMDYRGAYNATKFALEGYTDTLRLELHGSGIQVSLIEPGPIQSEFSKTAVKMFYEEIGEDTKNASHFRESYNRRLSMLAKGGTTKFKLPPDAVVQKLTHAIEAPKAKARYYVTVPTHIMGTLRRILPTSMIDMILRRSAKSEE
ncbi:putative oxidoreductase SadH [Pseudovibrio sp. W64]|uniref:SDR family oxidoreductase n=1 Tax=unclassified Pseudovibrio TaxID=2627060 RepID=UPI0007B19EE9|nr:MULTISPECIES: SDR family oxidoreductase [unclassified Pseudovibrio]KZK87902.1 putative oxidoreductase SadH [Pseudovibrio sp. W64]KZL16694.1 putative oxidoreductase SadH [Pseudovibrio sp. Ad26]